MWLSDSQITDTLKHWQLRMKLKPVETQSMSLVPKRERIALKFKALLACTCFVFDVTGIEYHAMADLCYRGVKYDFNF